MKRFRLIPLALLFALGPLTAQDPDEVYSVQFRAICLEGTMRDVALLTASGAVGIDVPQTRRSRVIEYRGSPRIRFIREPAPDAAPGQPVEPVASVVIPEGIRRPLLVFFSDPEREGAYRVQVFEDSVEGLPGGTTLFVNVSGYPLVILLGEDGADKVQLDPGGTAAHRFEASSINVRARIATLVEDEVKSGMDTRIFPLGNFRDICFLYAQPGERDGRIRLRILRENVVTARNAFERAAAP